MSCGCFLVFAAFFFIAKSNLVFFFQLSIIIPHKHLMFNLFCEKRMQSRHLCKALFAFSAYLCLRNKYKNENEKAHNRLHVVGGIDALLRCMHRKNWRNG